MAYREIQAEPRRPVPRLYLVTPRDPRGLAGRLAESLRAADIAAVLLRLRDEDERWHIDHIKSLVSAVQDNGTAILLEGHADLVAQAGADGAHLQGVDNLRGALSLLKPARIAGCGRLVSRHDAMLAGEAGADYVMFGEPGPKGERPSFDAVSERVGWWAELFEVPCVAYADSLDEIEALASVGADFVAVGDLVFTDRRGCSAAIAEAAHRLHVIEASA
jgi:thiamine-phosphate pyrophosphorylase